VSRLEIRDLHDSTDTIARILGIRGLQLDSFFICYSVPFLPVVRNVYDTQLALATLETTNFGIPKEYHFHRNTKLRRILKKSLLFLKLVVSVCLQWLESKQLPWIAIEKILWHIPDMNLVTITQIRSIMKNWYAGKVLDNLGMVLFLKPECISFGYKFIPDEFMHWVNSICTSDFEKKVIAGQEVSDEELFDQDLYDSDHFDSPVYHDEPASNYYPHDYVSSD
jgi:hypothetical protein